MEDLFRPFSNLRTLAPGDVAVNVVDILLVTFLMYRLLTLVRGTRAWRIMLGVIGFMIVLFASAKLKLNTLHWLLDKATYVGPVALAVFFLPELRTALEGFGRPASLIPRIVTSGQAEDRAEARTVEEIVAAVAELAAGRIGALIVLEKESPMAEIAANGVALDARISAALLEAIFYEGNPLHDGAVLIRGNAILAAACRLPSSDSTGIDASLHMRHRAGVGVTEAYDCLAIIVSEERGTISVASDGRLTKLNSHIDLRHVLNRVLRDLDDEPAKPKEPRPKRSQRRRNGEAKT